MKTIIFISFLLLFISCDPVDDRLTIINETNRPLFISISRFDSIESGNPLEDYMKICGQDTLWIDSDDFIKPHGKKNLSVISSWEDLIYDNYDDRSLKLFVFDADTLKNNDWYTTASNDNYLKKFKLTIDELKRLNWKIVVKK